MGLPYFLYSRGSLLDLTQKVHRRGTKVYFSAVVVTQVCALARYVILARLLGPEQLGLVTIIFVTAHFFESITETGADRFLIQDRAGDSDSVIRIVHLMAALRGIGVALLLILLAGLIADFTEAPQLKGALQTLAIVPFINGLIHYDFRVSQRDHDFRSEGAIVTASEVGGLVATTAAVLAVNDYTAILYGLAARAAILTAGSHLMAARAYRWGYSDKVARRFWRFGAPLIANGLLIFATTQSDRIIISRNLGLEELGSYSVVLLVILYPNAAFMRYLAAMFLPRLAAARDDPTRLSLESSRIGGIGLLLAIALFLGFALTGPPFIPLVFGELFRQESFLIALVGFLIAWRMMKVASTTIALALGNSVIVLTNNLVRLIAIPAALAGLHFVGGLHGVVGGFILGEILANLSATILVNRSLGWNPLRYMDRYVVFSFLGLAMLGGSLADPIASPGFGWLAYVAAAVLLCVALWRERTTVRFAYSRFR